MTDNLLFAGFDETAPMEPSVILADTVGPALSIAISAYVDPFDDTYDYCQICGVELDWVECRVCDGMGGLDAEKLLTDDPYWYEGADLLEWESCTNCDGRGAWQTCLNANNHPMPEEQTG